MRQSKVAAVLFLLVQVNFVLAAVSTVEKNALVDLYQSTSGSIWFTATNWLTGDPCENLWFGVTCNVDDTAVFSLHLPFNNLNGGIPDSTGYLLNLTSMFVIRQFKVAKLNSKIFTKRYES